MRKLAFIAAAAFCGLSAWAAPKIVVSHAFTLRGEPKYKAGFTHFDYVNPAAPKGGSVVIHDIGTYDNFHRYAGRGTAESNESFYDTLMTSSADETGVLYGLVAEKVEYPDDFSWIILHLNPKARFQDGKRITAADVVFTFDTFMTKGVPTFKQWYEGVKVEALDERRVRITPVKPDRETLHSLCDLPVFPKHYWSGKDFSEPLTTPPLGSGPYKVVDYKIGQYVVYERVKDYWAADLPVNVGRMNFDRIRYDYYRDDTIAFEAFKAGEYDLRQESVALNWATGYVGPVFDSGRIIKEEIPHELPQGMPAFVFNTTRPVFADRRVREAVNYLMDFEWMNKNLFYGQYTRTRSYFQNTEYEAKGLPGPEELRILEKIRDKIPPEVFTKEYNPPKTDGSGTLRSQTRAALSLLSAAGWQLRGGQLVDAKTGKPFEFELLMFASPAYERFAVPFQKSLERVGIKMSIRSVDLTQINARLRDRDYDMLANGFSAHAYPDTNLALPWHSEYYDSTYNQAGVKDPAIDYLIDGIVASQEDEKALLAWGRSLDRVLQWNYFVVPWWHQAIFRVAYVNKFSRPAVRPKYSLGLDTWWIDAKKAAALGAAPAAKGKR
jgi:microcin C transport system substrate-binding protein